MKCRAVSKSPHSSHRPVSSRTININSLVIYAPQVKPLCFAVNNGWSIWVRPVMRGSSEGRENFLQLSWKVLPYHQTPKMQTIFMDIWDPWKERPFINKLELWGVMRSWKGKRDIIMGKTLIFHQLRLCSRVPHASGPLQEDLWCKIWQEGHQGWVCAGTVLPPAARALMMTNYKLDRFHVGKESSL